MKVKALDGFSYYRLKVLEGLGVEDYRALGRGEIADIDKKIYDNNKHILEAVKPPSVEDIKPSKKE